MSYYKIRARRDTASNWTTSNPVLGLGELGYELDTNKLKIGDGVSLWNSLGYIESTAAAHNQDISTINGLQAALDAKASYSHAHTIADVSNLQNSLDGKASVSHAHYISDVTNLQSSLDGKSNIVHSHTISDTTGLQYALNAKSDIGHGHAYYEVEQDFHFQSNPPSGMAVGSRWMDSNTGIEYTYLYDGDSYQWVQSAAPIILGNGFNATRLVSTSGYYATDSDYYIGINYSGVATVVLQSEVDDGRSLIVKDESGYAGYANRYITISGAAVSGLIDNRDTATININNGSLQLIYRDGWRII